MVDGAPIDPFGSRWTKFRPHPEQQRLVRCRWWEPGGARMVYICKGRQSGGSELAKRHIALAQALELKGGAPRRYFYAAPTRQQAKDLAWEDLLALIPAAWIGNPDRDISWSELSIRTLFNSKIQLVGLEKGQRSEGVSYDGGIVDEMSDVIPRSLTTSLWPTLSSTHGWCWHVGVPKRFGVGARHFRERWEAARNGESPDSAAFWWPSTDILTPDEIAFWKDTLDPVDFEEQLNASWLSATGRIFHAFDRDYNLRSCSFDPDAPLIVGADFNVNPMAWTFGHIREAENGKPIMETFDELWMRDANTPAALDAAWSRYGQHCRAGARFYGDAASRARKTSASASDYQHIAKDERFKRIGATVHFPKANPPIEDRFAAANAFLCNAAGMRRWFIDERCKRLIADLEFRSYKEGKREPDDRAKDSGHISDAATYVIARLFPIGAERPKGKIGVHMTSGRRRARSA